jgi:hypothetical protein
MNQDLRENLKVGLLGIIAVTLIINTFVTANKKSGFSAASAATTENTENGTPSAAIATPGNNEVISTTVNPNENPVTSTTNQKKTRIQFGSYMHDFGKVKQETTNKYSFSFTNTGDEPLIITSAVGSCGCTVPQWPKDPIPPGGTGKIDVEYKPGQQEGSQEKKVTVTANTEPGETILTLKAEVQKI